MLSVDDPVTAIRAVAAMQAGGISCVEVALRSPNALSVLAKVVLEFPELLVGAGTLTAVEDFQQVVNAGARFAVSPGSTVALLEAATRWDIPYLPAAATVSEMLMVMQMGFTDIKVFPAERLGGCQYLRDISAPLGSTQFVPSGGINLGNLVDYLNVPTVVAVSGSWMLRSDWLQAANWAEVTRVSRASIDAIRGI